MPITPLFDRVLVRRSEAPSNNEKWTVSTKLCG